jgi:hypothetical protein
MPGHTSWSYIATSFYAASEASIRGKVYYLQMTPAAAQGAVGVVASAGAGTSDASGEASAVSSQFTFPYDAVKPTVRRCRLTLSNSR